MTKELLNELISQRLFFELFVICISFLAVNFINTKLAIQMLGLKIEFKKMFIGILCMVLYNLYGRQFLSDLAYGLVLVFVFILILKVIGRIALIKVCWTAFLVMLVTGFGVLIIQEPPCSSNKQIASFILETPYGVAIGSFIELLIPSVILFILSTFQISLIPPYKNKITFLDFLGVFLFGDIFFLSYNSFVQIVMGFKDDFKYVKMMNVTAEWAAAIAGGVAFYLILTFSRIERENEQLMYEREKDVLLNNFKEIMNTNNIVIVDDIIQKMQNTNNTATGQANSNSVLTNVNPELLALTPRERIVLDLIVQGKTNKEIAAEIYLSEGGIKNIVTKLLGRYKLLDRTQLAVYAVKNDLIRME